MSINNERNYINCRTEHNIDLSSDINIYHTFDEVLNEFESQSKYNII